MNRVDVDVEVEVDVERAVGAQCFAATTDQTAFSLSNESKHEAT
jgi:hypothetical protein